MKTPIKSYFSIIQFVLLIVFHHQISAQVLNNLNDTTSRFNYLNNSDQTMNEVVYGIVRYTGLYPNFIIIPNNKIPNAIAYIKSGNRIIAYNPTFMMKIVKDTKNNWAGISVLAHEIGHHLAGHTIQQGKNLVGDELIADKFSGFILNQMGATLNEALMAMKSLVSAADSVNHPPKTARLDAITLGWNEAELLHDKKFSLNAQSEQILFRSKFLWKCKFYGDNNVYFVDDKHNIIWFDNFAKPIVIGKQEESKNHQFDWIYHYEDEQYGVDQKGNMWKETEYGAQIIIGKVENYKE